MISIVPPNSGGGWRPQKGARRRAMGETPAESRNSKSGRGGKLGRPRMCEASLPVIERCEGLGQGGEVRPPGWVERPVGGVRWVREGTGEEALALRRLAFFDHHHRSAVHRRFELEGIGGGRVFGDRRPTLP